MHLLVILAIGMIILYIMIITLVSSSVRSSSSGTEVMYILSIIYLIGAGSEFAAVIYIIKNKLNLQ